ncbi:F420-non-reducing hydrogenase subunit cytochrome B [Methanocella paludicola SANAE]|uniref:F420-non-reducing hydrogenase subunit cytochrome B n=1 Tax=Methanocella paludicola (strain DSM 17711 / JCM 13418 / NBRC 101707 / SANAE) TaxID=304371 RepID=D1Z2T6_METPS|nr:cytochrome b/b6 domain-containing protein [Methanocella paludicola]BAI63008.1 F420-non-reducing hydrogenase subunit cytochrome B [Methanocella paludicola SANAE]
MDRLIVTRHTTLERLSHYTNIASLALLLASGFSMYLGLPYLSYGDSYSIHIISAAAFIANNWIVMPYTAFMNRSLSSYFFWPMDFRRLWGIIKNFFTGSEYPPYSVYDIGKGRFANRLHPGAKLLLYSHYAALFVATATGIVLYSGSVTVLGFGVSSLIVRALDMLAPSFHMPGMALALVLHMAAAYWFVAEAIIHVGMVQLDPKKSQHIRSIFLHGKEDLYADPTADIVDTSESSKDFEEKTAVEVK